MAPKLRQHTVSSPMVKIGRISIHAPYPNLTVFQIQATATPCSSLVSLVTNPSTTQFIFVVLHLNFWIFSPFLPIEIIFASFHI